MESSGKGLSRASPRSDDQRALLESAERVAQIGSWEWTPETGELLWSDNLFGYLGWSRVRRRRPSNWCGR
jgi:hypothetical protein